MYHTVFSYARTRVLFTFPIRYNLKMLGLGRKRLSHAVTVEVEDTVPYAIAIDPTAGKLLFME